MPVVVNKSGPQKGPASSSTSSPTGGQTKQPVTVSTPVFIAAVGLVLLIVAFLAYRTFGPSGGWDNSKTGAPVTAGALGAPPTPHGSGQAGSETPSQGATQDAMPGTEMPPNPGG